MGAAEAEALSHAYDSRETIGHALQHVLTYRPLSGDLREQVITDSLAAGDEARLAWPTQGITEDITAAAQAIEVPVHVLAGRHDQVEPPALLQANLLPVIPGARMTVIEGTGHLSPLETPGQVADLLNQMAASLTLRPASRGPG